MNFNLVERNMTLDDLVYAVVEFHGKLTLCVVFVLLLGLLVLILPIDFVARSILG